MKPYYSLNTYLKNIYGEKVYKIALNAGLTCPNRDGSLDTGGCIFCSHGGSGDFASPLLSADDFHQSLEDGKKRLSLKYTGTKFIAYFQAYTNTYGPVSYLEEIYRNALSDENVVGISIATRPDCFPYEVLELLGRLKKEFPHKFIWIELGLQTIHERTAKWIRRGYPLSCFEDSLKDLQSLDIPVIVHLILGLPGETTKDMISSVSYLNDKPVWGVKLQLLHILKGTDLADLYIKYPDEICIFKDRDDYIAAVITCLEHLRPNMVIHRVTGDAPKSLLIAPAWSGGKHGVLNALHQKMQERHAYQGRLYEKEDAYVRPLNSL